MDAFPRRSRASDATGEITSLPVLSPVQVQDLFTARLEEICSGFEEWSFPLVVAGRLGECPPNTYPKYYQLPLIDLQGGGTLALEILKSVLAQARVEPGDVVRVSGTLRARHYRGQVVLRFEVVTVALHDPEQHRATQAERSIMDVLRGLPCGFHPYPDRADSRLVLLHSAASSALVAEDFMAALGGGWRSERLRTRPVSMTDPHRLAEAIAGCREEILVIVRGGGETSDFVVFEHPLVLEALATYRGHRVLGVGHSANRTLAERVVDHAATTPSDAGHYIRRMSGRLWETEEENRAQQEELVALRESVALATTPLRPAPAARLGIMLRNAVILIVLGTALGLFLSRLL